MLPVINLYQFLNWRYPGGSGYVPIDTQLIIQLTRNAFVRRQIYLPILLFLGVQLLSAQTLDPSYHTYTEINAYLDSLAQVPAFQPILSVVQIGQSNNYNLPLKAVKISDNPTEIGRASCRERV